MTEKQPSKGLLLTEIGQKEMEKCECDKDKIEDAKRRAVKRKGPYMCDEEGNILFYVDSFGFREAIPGECDLCYQAFKDAYHERFAGMYD